MTIEYLRTLDLTPEWSQNNNGKLTPMKLSRIAAKRLKDLKPIKVGKFDADRLKFVVEFDLLGEEKATTDEDFDDVMERLYKWADAIPDAKFRNKHLCHVKIC